MNSNRAQDEGNPAAAGGIAGMKSEVPVFGGNIEH
jgi:hypothetical protein